MSPRQVTGVTRRRRRVMQSQASNKTRGRSASATAAAAFALVYVLAVLAARQLPLAPSLRIVVVLLPVPAFAWFMLAWAQEVRASDELRRRIQLEALAFAFPAFTLLLMTLGLLQMVVELPPQDLSYRHVWAMTPLFYYLGLALANRRYR
jgi:hypothetical protein